jgi:hypothetical protein
MADSPTRVTTTIGKSIKRWWAAPARLKAILAAATLAAAAPALLLVPLLLTTATTLLAPAPWDVPDAQRGPVLFAAVVGWVVLPFAVGAWRRRWWWSPLCLIVVLVTALSWGEGLVVGGYGEYGHGAPAATVEVLRPALVLGALAALMGAAGVALTPALGRLAPRIRHGLVAAALTAGIVPVVVGWVVLLVVSADAGLGGALSALVLLITAHYGPYQAGRWIGQGWWVLPCLLIPPALVWFWAPPYADAVPSLSPTGYVIVFVLFGFGFMEGLVGAVFAGVGVILAGGGCQALPRSGPASRA